jgi:tetratricopeptide (TPR) repeat protein
VDLDALRSAAVRTGRAADWLAFTTALAEAGRPVDALRYLRALWREVPAAAAAHEAGALDRSAFLLNGGALAATAGLARYGRFCAAAALVSPHPDIRFLARANLDELDELDAQGPAPRVPAEALPFLVDVIVDSAAEERAAALADLRAAVTAAPTGLAAVAWLARALAAAGRPDEAAEQAERAVALAGPTHVDQYNAAVLLLERGEPDRAARHARDALRRAGDAQEARDARRLLARLRDRADRPSSPAVDDAPER